MLGKAHWLLELADAFCPIAGLCHVPKLIRALAILGSSVVG